MKSAKFDIRQVIIDILATDDCCEQTLKVGQ
jgi:hypothetical protein